MASPKTEDKLPAHLEIDEMTALLDTPDTGTPLGRRDRAMLELFYASGLRLSELVGLDMDDVNLSGRMVRVLGKGGKERVIPFNQSAADALRAYLKDRPALEHAAQQMRAGPGRPPAREGLPRPAPRRSAASSPLFLNFRGGRLTGRTHSGTRSRRTCSSVAPICARSRNCWATRSCPPPSAIRTSARRS